MIDALVELMVAAAIDVEGAKAARKYRWVRTVRALGGILFVAVIAGAICITFKYS